MSNANLKKKFKRYIYKVMYANGGKHFFVNIGKFGLWYFRELKVDFYKTSQVC